MFHPSEGSGERQSLCAVRHRIDGVRQKVVIFSDETLDDVNEKDGVREYSGTAGLACNCCAKMKDGVLTLLRMIVSRVKVNKDQHDMCTLTLSPFTDSIHSYPLYLSFAASLFCKNSIFLLDAR